MVYSLIKPLSLTEVFRFVVLMAPFSDGISYACNTTCHETPGMNLSLVFGIMLILRINILLNELMLHPGKIEEVLAILESYGSSYSSCSGNTFCKNISSIINFFGENQINSWTFGFYGIFNLIVIQIWVKVQWYWLRNGYFACWYTN